MSLTRHTIVPIVVLSIGLSACGGNSKNNKKTPARDTTALSSYQGTWLQEGAGLSINISGDHLTAYNYTRNTCSIISRFNNIPLDEASKVLTTINAGEDGTGFSFLFAGDIEDNRQVFSATTLSDTCNNAPDPNVFNPEFIFEHTWHTFNDYYPFFQRRVVNWQNQWDTLRPQIHAQTTQEELAEILADLLSPIDDGHVSLFINTSELQTAYFPATLRGWDIHAKAYDNEADIGIDTAYQHIQLSSLTNIARYYGESAISYAGDNELPVAWGILTGNVGYMNILEMDVDVEDDKVLSINEKIDIIHQQFTTILDDLSDTQALIIDLRFNPGGSDVFSLAIASYFADQRRVVFSKENYNINNPTAKKSVFITPNNKANYTKPITLITGPNTASAAETFTLAMKSLPHVKHIGEASAGILSDVLTISLMNGWNLGLSYQTYYAPDNTVYEATGITPENTVPVTSFAGIQQIGAQPAIEKALTDFGVERSLSDEDFTRAVDDIMSTTKVPGFSVAWINDSRVIGTQAFGFADQQQRLVTSETPFTVGSISKTLIGTAAMQMIEQNIITQDTTLGDVGIPLSIDSPVFDAQAITLKQLATHTSGIIDNEITYGCGYYINANNDSLFAQFNEQYSDCPSPVETNQRLFLNSLLSNSGALYQEQHFMLRPDDKRYIYTNTGSALAAEMLSAAAGIDFENWTETAIFTPLGMTHTHWFSDRFSQQDIAPATRYILLDDEAMALPEYHLATWSDGGLKTSASDLARYLLTIVRKGELDGERILSVKSVDTMLNINIDEPTIEGQRLFWTNDGFIMGHNGGDPGTYALMFYDQYNKLGLVMMLNLTDELNDEGEIDAFYQQLSNLNHLVYRRGLSLIKDTNAPQ